MVSLTKKMSTNLSKASQDLIRFHIRVLNKHNICSTTNALKLLRNQYVCLSIPVQFECFNFFLKVFFVCLFF